MRRRAKLDRAGQVWVDNVHSENVWLVLASWPERPGSDYWQHRTVNLCTGVVQQTMVESRRFTWDDAWSMTRID